MSRYRTRGNYLNYRKHIWHVCVSGFNTHHHLLNEPLPPTPAKPGITQEPSNQFQLPISRHYTARPECGLYKREKKLMFIMKG